MARNVVQFQKGLSEPAFDRQYGIEEQCRAVVIALRWPDGFCCPACGGREHSMVKTRDLFQCTACRRQTSPIAGTIFASTKLALRTWFRAVYHLTQTKQGISSIELGRRLGVTQTTAWVVKHELKQVMMERDATKPLTGRVKIDDAYLGGERSGGKRGRGAPGTTPFVAAVETTPKGKPVRLKLGRVASFCSASISSFAKRSLDPGLTLRVWPACTVISDGLQCFGGVTDAGCAHQAIKTGSGPAAARTPAFKWVNTALGNIKAAITGIYRAINSKHVPRCLAEFEYRLNRRHDLATMIPRLCWAGVRTVPMPYQLLKLAEVYA
jgi:transposase-like protein